MIDRVTVKGSVEPLGNHIIINFFRFVYMRHRYVIIRPCFLWTKTHKEGNEAQKSQSKDGKRSF